MFIILMMAILEALSFFSFLKTTSHVTTPATNQTVKKVELNHPVIGYKKARLNPTYNWGNFFEGIMGTPYGLNETLSGNIIEAQNGFHMYSNIKDAVEHCQGNGVNYVLLEVIGYGDVEIYEKGFIVSGQRVLQMILGRCYKCGSQATTFDITNGEICDECAIKFGERKIYKNEDIVITDMKYFTPTIINEVKHGQ